MITIYSSQDLGNEVVVDQPNNVQTNEEQWWFVYDATTKIIVVEPLRCCGFTSSPFTMVIADTKEEIDTYIQENNLQYPPVLDGSDSILES